MTRIRIAHWSLLATLVAAAPAAARPVDGAGGAPDGAGTAPGDDRAAGADAASGDAAGAHAASGDAAGAPAVVGATASAGPEPATSGWFRIDTDALGTQLWVGATHSVGDWALASDIYVVGSFAELDLGPSLAIGPATFTPMVGIGFDFAAADFASLIAPQLFTVVDLDRAYVESWVQVFFNSPFSDGAEDLAYTRNFALYKLSDAVHVGPQIEVGYRLNDFAGDAAAGAAPFSSGLVSLPIGGRVNLGYGDHNTLGLFVGYETQAASGADAVAGRFTFVRTW